MRYPSFNQAVGLGMLFLSTAAAVPFQNEPRPRAAASSKPTQTVTSGITSQAAASQTDDPFTGSTPTRPPTATSVVSDATRPATDHRSPPPSSVTVARAAMTPYLYGCNKTEKSIVMQAWQEAGMLADAHAKWKPPGWFSSGAYQPAMDMYLGTDSQKDDPWFGTGPLKQNINRQQGIHTSNEDWSPYWSYAYVYCDESKVPSKPNKPKQDECNRPNNPGKKVMAYTFPDDGSIFGWNAKYVVLCPRFFDTDILTLEQQTNNAKSDKSLQQTINPWRKVKARSLFHETYHWGPAEVSDPVCDRKPEIYDPSQVTSLAKTENVKGSSTNAESWAQAAMACYVQQTFNLKNPPAPADQSVANVTDDFEEQFFDSAPDWFQSPVALDASSYAPVNDSDTSSTSPSATPTSTTPTKPSETPLESCHTQYKLVLDSFDIYGFDWDQSKLDAGGSPNSGSGLLKQLRGCSAITDWHFETLTVDAKNPYQWHASGQTTIWQKNCIEHAMASAGSPSESCSGSG